MCRQAVVGALQSCEKGGEDGPVSDSRQETRWGQGETHLCAWPGM